MKEKLFILFLLASVSFKSSYAQIYNNDYPTYYTKGKVYIYQNMDSQSAIKGEVPSGRKVKVINSFFGTNTGFWEISYDGTTGWVKKSQLSYRKTSTSKATNQTHILPKRTSSKNIDVGFDPFIAVTTASVNFREGPSSNFRIIKTLSPQSPVYVYSDKAINNYYKAIDVKTTQIGWIYKKYVKYLEDVKLSKDANIKSTGLTKSYDSEVFIKNNTSYAIKLVVGDQIFDLEPNSSKKYKIIPGRNYFIASAPGVIPASGYHTFKSNHGYDWDFIVKTTKY